MTREDFQPDTEGLQAALSLLIEKRASPGAAHVEPADLPLTWPHEGVGSLAALQSLAGPALDDVTRLDHPGFIAHMDPPTPWVTWAAAMWVASMNQNLLQDETAPSARALESLVIDWLAPNFGMNGGHLVPGSTVATLTALWAARDVRDITHVVCSSAAHVSVRKCARLLDLQLLEVPADADQQLPLDNLPDDLRRSAVVLTAGTTATGSIDPLSAQLDAGWVHVDAAWAGPLRLSSHAALLDGIDTADSVAVSAHKWLYQPKESAMVLFRDAAGAKEALSFGASYLSTPNVGLLGSHGNAALPLAATLLAWGRDGLRRRIDEDMARSYELADLVVSDTTLELRARPVTGVVNWRPRGADPAAVRQRLRDAWVSLTDIDGETWFRSVFANPNADPGRVVAAVHAAFE